MTTEVVALGITVIIQVVALVWGAAKMHSAINALEKTTAKLDSTLDKIVDRVQEHSEVIAALRAKVGL